MANIPWGFGFERVEPNPLDSRAVFDTLADFETFLTTGLAYAGQVAAVRDGTNVPKMYVVNNDGHSHTEVGAGGGSMPEPPDDDKIYARAREAGEAAGEWRQITESGAPVVMPEPPDDDKVHGRKREPGEADGEWVEVKVPTDDDIKSLIFDNNMQSASIQRTGAIGSQELNIRGWHEDGADGLNVLMRPNKGATPQYKPLTEFIPEVDANNRSFVRRRRTGEQFGYWDELVASRRLFAYQQFSSDLDRITQSGFYESGDVRSDYPMPAPPGFFGTNYATRFVLLVESSPFDNGLPGTTGAAPFRVKQTITAVAQADPAGPKAGTSYMRVGFDNAWGPWERLHPVDLIPEPLSINFHGVKLDDIKHTGFYDSTHWSPGNPIQDLPPGFHSAGDPPDPPYTPAFQMLVQASEDGVRVRQTITVASTFPVPPGTAPGGVAWAKNGDIWGRTFHGVEWTPWERISPPSVLPAGGQRYQVLGRTAAVGGVSWQWPGARGSTTVIGSGALPATTSYSNTAVGYTAMASTTSGSYNVGIGSYALESVVSGHYNTAVGSMALRTYAGSYSTAVGYQALGSLGYGQPANSIIHATAVGYNALGQSFFAPRSTAVGYCALANNQGDNNTAVGHSALGANMGGTYCTAIGNRALERNTNGNRNTALGCYALERNTTGGNNIAIGHYALDYNVTGSFNLAIGTNALRDNTDYHNTAVGNDALHSNKGGYRNTAVGYNAMGSNTGGYENTAVGYNALANNTSGERLVAIGGHAGIGSVNGHQSIFIGYGAKPAGNTQYNQIVIGDGTTGGGSNSVTIGNSGSTGTHRTQVGWTVGISDVRGKEDIELANLDRCVDAVKQLPVSRWKWRDFLARPNQHEIGWIADDVEKVFPKSISVMDEQYGDHIIENCRHHNAHHEALPTLWAATQRLLQRIESLETELRSRKGNDHHD